MLGLISGSWKPWLSELHLGANPNRSKYPASEPVYFSGGGGFEAWRMLSFCSSTVKLQRAQVFQIRTYGENSFP